MGYVDSICQHGFACTSGIRDDDRKELQVAAVVYCITMEESIIIFSWEMVQLV
jgi:hypothetical protein